MFPNYSSRHYTESNSKYVKFEINKIFILYAAWLSTMMYYYLLLKYVINLYRVPHIKLILFAFVSEVNTH
jgi:hypothetical protein